MSTKTLVCRCEDVTLSDVKHAMGLGYGNIEEVKRYTGLGTGPCEGKECMALCAMLLIGAAKEAGTAAPPPARSSLPPPTGRPFTARPPVAPVSLATLAGGEETDEESAS